MPGYALITKHTQAATVQDLLHRLSGNRSRPAQPIVVIPGNSKCGDLSPREMLVNAPRLLCGQEAIAAETYEIAGDDHDVGSECRNALKGSSEKAVAHPFANMHVADL